MAKNNRLLHCEVRWLAVIDHDIRADPEVSISVGVKDRPLRSIER